MAFVNLTDLETAARGLLPQPVFDNYCGGSHDEITLRENRAAYVRLTLHYHVLRGRDACDTTTTVLGHTLRETRLRPSTPLERAAIRLNRSPL
jgi:isopentenyl diphosphate isomerase/L-lactate dehydrogenase-like FMN-dependent dehydrogenase